MYKQLVVNVATHETRVALVEDGTIAELFIQRKHDTDIAGNIYKGRVQRVLPGMQAAFVDIGLDQAAFLYVSDIVSFIENDVPQSFIDDAAFNGVDGADRGMANGTGSALRNQRIEDLISEGQEILVHVAKSPIGTKGARVTTHISMPGRFLVLMPTSDHIGVSRRIEDEAERSRLKTLISSLRDEPFGYIVRTAAEGTSEEKMKKEMRFLTNLWEDIQKRFHAASAPSILHKELDVSLRAVRDLLTHEVEKLVIDSREGYHSILGFLDTFMPGLKASVEFYDDPEPIFDAYNLEGDIARALKRKVWLKSGGYIVIEETEALVAIDVNTGRYVGRHNLEETILKTNLEAVREIAYQIRLRDIGGIIIIDFIDMEKKSSQEKVFHAFQEALKKDRSKTHVLPISELGLVQMTRKRVKQALTRIMREPCLYCDGEGHQISRRSISYRIFREIQEVSSKMSAERFTLRVNPEIAEWLHGEENQAVMAFEKHIGKQIVIYPEPRFHLEEFDIVENLLQ